MPAVPALLLGFLCLEGHTLVHGPSALLACLLRWWCASDAVQSSVQVEHELSVPAVSVMMASCAAFAMAAMAGARLGQRITPQRRSQLQGIAALGSLGPAVAVRAALRFCWLWESTRLTAALQVGGVASALALVCTSMAVLGSAASAIVAGYLPSGSLTLPA